jgi:hypothetical protein
MWLLWSYLPNTQMKCKNEAKESQGSKSGLVVWVSGFCQPPLRSLEGSYAAAQVLSPERSCAI